MRYALAPVLAIAALALCPGASGAGEAVPATPYGTQAARPRTAAQEAWQARIARGRMDYEAFVARALRKYMFVSAPPRDARADKTETPILQDPTLRAGDIYAAADGFRVFRGRAAATHLPADFAPMPQTTARDLSLAMDPPSGGEPR